MLEPKSKFGQESPEAHVRVSAREERRPSQKSRAAADHRPRPHA